MKIEPNQLYTSVILHNLLIYNFLTFPKIAYVAILKNINVLIFNQLTKKMYQARTII